MGAQDNCKLRSCPLPHIGVCHKCVCVCVWNEKRDDWKELGEWSENLLTHRPPDHRALSECGRARPCLLKCPPGSRAISDTSSILVSSSAKKKEIALTSPPLNLTNQLADFEHGKAKTKRGQSGHLVPRVLWLHRSTVSTVCPEWERGRQAATNDDRGPEVSESHSTGPRRYHAGIILTASFRQVRWFISSGRNRSLPTFVQNGEGIPLFRWLVMLTLTPSRSWYQFQPTPFCSLRS